ncbi:prephenate dehydrogenase [Shewanella algae]|uniref:prephenate dehydrogenase n=1 Tax=Shewanella algae TaxID=38313 RepID=UPI0031F57857
MPYTKVIEQLKANLQTAYRQAVDADNRLDQLQQAGHGKFSAVFTQEQGFTTCSNRFLPYVQELAQAVADLEAETAPTPEQLEALLPKPAVLLQTLQKFKQQSK